MEGYFKISFFAISVQWNCDGLDDTENNKFPRHLTISLRELSVQYLVLIDFMTSGLQFSGIDIDAISVYVTVNPELVGLVIAELLDCAGMSESSVPELVFDRSEGLSVTAVAVDW